jgi:cytochrome c-type biogenesis protein CcmH/NrfG
LELNPRLPLALNTMGVVYARQGDFAHAVQSWQRAVEIDPRQYDALLTSASSKAAPVTRRRRVRR